MASTAERWGVLEQLDDWLRLPMAILGLAWLLLVLAELVWGGSQLFEVAGTIIWIIFIAEFAIRLLLAPDRSTFLRRNWRTIVALIVPALRFFRSLAMLRAARSLRGLRLVRIVGTANRSMNALRVTPRRRRFGYVLMLTGLIVLPRNWRPAARTAVLLGAEGPGLPTDLIGRTNSLRIAMSNGFDSLNVATTSGIVLHHLSAYRA
jgi:hypothetical protein